MRSFSVIFILGLGVCNSLDTDTDRSSSTTEPSSEGSGYTWGSAPDDGSDNDDCGDCDDDDEDTDTEDTEDDTDADDSDDPVVVTEVTAYVVIAPAAEWEASLDTDGHPTVYMYEVANFTDGDWDGYGETAYLTSDGGCVLDGETFTPGDTLVVNAKWWDGTAWRYFADKGDTVRSEMVDWDDDGDVEMAVVVRYLDNSYDILPIDSTGTETGEGSAYYVPSTWVDEAGVSHSSQDLYVHTNNHTTGDYTE